MPLTKVQLGKVRDVDKRQLSSKDASRLMGAVIQTDEGIRQVTWMIRDRNLKCEIGSTCTK